VQSNRDDCKENISCNINAKLVDVCCEKCLKHLNSLMETMTKILPLPLDKSTQNQMPLVSINVVDTDNNLKICMCNATEIGDNMKDIILESSTVCPKCKNVIKAQSSERCPLISKQTMLGDVLFNGTDSQYLSSTYSTKSNAQLKRLMDPYTPESIESHSPQTEMEELSFINTTIESDDILENMREVIKHKSEIAHEDIDVTERNHFVTPHQLTTRLEILRRESQLDCSSKKSGSGSSNAEESQIKDSRSSKHCSSCCSSCSIS
jgi:hypothetical protein